MAIVSVGAGIPVGTGVRIDAGTGVPEGFVVGAPGATAGGESQELTIEFINASGGALTTAPTFVTGSADSFLLNGAAVNPGAGLSVFYKFRWSSPRSRWVEILRSAAI